MNPFRSKSVVLILFYLILIAAVLDIVLISAIRAGVR